MAFDYYRNNSKIGLEKEATFSGIADLNMDTAFKLAGGVFTSLQDIAKQLAAISASPTISNITSGGVQSIIESARDTFNVFAVVGYNSVAENLGGVSSSTGTTSFSSSGFVYNSSSSNIISTGYDIELIKDAPTTISAINNRAWMASAVFDGTSNSDRFKGIILWVFNNRAVNSSGVFAANRIVTKTRDIFYPAGSSSNYHEVLKVIIDTDGTILTSDVTGGDNSGWNFSNGSATDTTGYNSTSRISGDDGAWGYNMTTETDGNSPGPSLSTSQTGFGINNADSSDGTADDVYWNGSVYAGGSNVSYIFTGDRLP